VPNHWMDESTGVLRPVVEAYLSGQRLSAEQLLVMRAYLHQWMEEPWKTPMLDVLRTQIGDIATQEDLDRWVARALEADIDDPF
jgi:hypothetical protein